jgi:hypothetical protein
MDKFRSTPLKQSALHVANALRETLPGNRTVTVYEVADVLYVVVKGPKDCDHGYTLDNAARQARREKSVPVVTDHDFAVSCFMATGRSLANDSDVPVLTEDEIKLLLQARKPAIEVT